MSKPAAPKEVQGSPRVVVCPDGHLKTSRAVKHFYCHGRRFPVAGAVLKELPKVAENIPQVKAAQAVAKKASQAQQARAVPQKARDTAKAALKATTPRPLQL